jgi:hypothetical protein
MSVQASTSRPAAKSIGAAFVDLILTLVILVVVMLSFLLAPLLALGVAFLTYSVWRPSAGRKKRTTAQAQPGQPGQPARDAAAAHGFGAGTS